MQYTVISDEKIKSFKIALDFHEQYGPSESKEIEKRIFDIIEKNLGKMSNAQLTETIDQYLKQNYPNVSIKNPNDDLYPSKTLEVVATLEGKFTITDEKGGKFVFNYEDVCTIPANSNIISGNTFDPNTIFVKSQNDFYIVDDEGKTHVHYEIDPTFNKSHIPNLLDQLNDDNNEYNNLIPLDTDNGLFSCHSEYHYNI